MSEQPPISSLIYDWNTAVLTDDEILEICKFEKAGRKQPLHLETLPEWKQEVNRR